MDASLPHAKSSGSNDPARERQQIRRIVAERGLCGLANDTKWDEFISGMRARPDWRPSYRYRAVTGWVSEWDVEWFYHLPFPFLGVEWFDIGFLQKKIEHRLPVRIHFIDHSEWIEGLLRSAGLDYQKGDVTIRVFGYSPKSLDLFEVE